MFMARINTAHVRAKGKAATADWLLKLQIEWADVLHRYETHGIAVKPGRHNALRQLHQMIRSRERLRDPSERAALTALIHQELAALGLPAEMLNHEQQQSALPFVISPV